MLYTIVAVLVLVLDQAVKFWTVNNIMPQAIGDECVTLIPGVLHMTNVQNNGAAFSILADQRWLLVAVSALFIIGIIVLISMDIIHTKFGRWTAVLVMAGALGNCIDRVLYGYVVDMFEFELFSFAVFNIADIFITVCGILFCIHVIIYREPIEEYNAVPHKQRPVKQKAVKQKSVRQRPAKRLRRAAREDEELDLELEDAGSYEDEEEDEEDEPRPARRAARTKEPARAKKKDKPDPYANIPKRGVHRPLEEEIRPQNPDDPFAEWGFGPDAEPAVRRAPAPAKEEKPAEKAAAAPAPRKGRVAPTQADEQPPEPGVPEERPARREDAPAPAKKPEPAKKPQDELDAGFGDYSLEDILSEFRDS